jgi:CelD/BcsL family acetyltransferase involved in cellulose biosynthesis
LNTNLIISEETFAGLESMYQKADTNLNWNLVFTTPAWLQAWWQSFRADSVLHLRSVSQNQQIIGIAPLQFKDSTASIVGNIDVCDYQDFIITQGKEAEFYDAILDDLEQNNISDLHLETIRADSTIASYLMPIAQAKGYKVAYQQSDVSSDMTLSKTWEDYLASLDGKQRHELRRKMRNLENLGEYRYRCISEQGEMPAASETFLKLFPESRGDKAQFMTAEMQKYFRNLTLSLASAGVVRFGSLEFGGKAVAMVMYFDYNDNIYLYNSAYDPEYRSLSVGLISKALCIKDSLEKGKKRFDFLKGPEQYKSHLGGTTIPLYRCHISLK